MGQLWSSPAPAIRQEKRKSQGLQYRRSKNARKPDIQFVRRPPGSTRHSRGPDCVESQSTDSGQAKDRSSQRVHWEQDIGGGLDGDIRLEKSRKSHGSSSSKHNERPPRKAEANQSRSKHSKNPKPHASTTTKHPREAPETKECMICVETRSHHRFPTRPPTEACTHAPNVCRRCLRTWIQTSFTTKIWNEINCPTCSSRLHHNDMHAFAPRHILTRYTALRAKAAYEAIPNFRWCIAKGCKSGQVHDPGSARFRCMACRKSYCVQHGVPWHTGETCGEYEYRTDKSVKKGEERASQRVIEQTTKKCPGCGRRIEKSYGCDHMTCSKCKHEFCWQCRAPYSKKGTRRVIHRVGCEYFDPQ